MKTKKSNRIYRVLGPLGLPRHSPLHLQKISKHGVIDISGKNCYVSPKFLPCSRSMLRIVKDTSHYCPRESRSGCLWKAACLLDRCCVVLDRQQRKYTFLGALRIHSSK